MAERSAFSGGDQEYLRNVQYADGTKLDARAHLHLTYSSSSESFPQFEAGLIDWPTDGTVLECGSGTGLFWNNGQAPRSLAITLTDLSPGMVAEAVACAEANGFSAIDSDACDVQELPFEDATFDIVVANHMLYHVPDPDRAVAELARVMSDDGVLLAGTNGYGHMGELNDAIADVWGTAAEGLYEVFGIDTGEARLREQFSSVAWHAYDNDLLVTEPADAVAYGLSFPPGETATAAEQAAFARAIERRFVDGALRIRTRAGAFVCREPRGRF
ncbi:MAG: class I SAM-dependent methyltransferase [Acidimicrobiales bacterium]|nr:class I SAM-dependent methyltransferase [Acidimicrobiales bacterium]